jgi:hypothetical protein
MPSRRSFVRGEMFILRALEYQLIGKNTAFAFVSAHVCGKKSQQSFLHGVASLMTPLEDLLKKSIPELSDLFVRRQRRVPKGLLEALDVDRRQGAHQLAKRIRERYRENRSEGQRLHFLLRFEIELWSQGFGMVAGVDEAGMAPLAGPVVAGAVILPQNYKLRGLNDSRATDHTGCFVLVGGRRRGRRDRQDKYLSRRPARDAASGAGSELTTRLHSR